MSARFVIGIVLLGLGIDCVYAHPPAEAAKLVDQQAEDAIHTPPGFQQAGKPLVADGSDTGLVKLRIVDRATGEPTFCRVNVVGSDGNYYEPAENTLAPYSLHRLGNRAGKGPFRYYGWFFYTAGESEVRVPTGATRVEVWRGYEYRPLVQELDVKQGATESVRLTLERGITMTDLGYYSGDVHIHLDRRNDAEEARALDLMMAEDMQYGVLLANNQDGRNYSGLMERNLHQQRAFGLEAIKSRGNYSIAAGQEIVGGTYGHILLFLHDRLVLEGASVEPNYWPPLGVLGSEARKLKGFAFHAHGGYAKEIYADFARRDTNGVELLQFAEYRGVALEGWYHMLNIGYQFPALGACDYPYCRALGDCRTYVFSPERPTFAQWCQRLAEGRSFFTTGPMLLLEVDGHRPGDVIERSANDKRPLKVRVKISAEVGLPREMAIVVNGQPSFTMSRSDRPLDIFQYDGEINVDYPMWIAAKCWTKSPPGQPDVEAHTNPVYVTVDGRPPYREGDVDWLVARLDDLIAEFKNKKKFAEQEAAVEYFQQARQKLADLRAAGGSTKLIAP
ncbi:MAG: CehA/McbA family metallohydrolase [Planctomycetes bacterium]|nr:CehA/McbA family metallohydrolase [Planctomycetota bacterium]